MFIRNLPTLKGPSEGDTLHPTLDTPKFHDPYLPLNGRKGEIGLVSFSGCTEGLLRKAIKAGELKHYRNSPRGKILVRTSWFDEWVDRQPGERFRVYKQARQFVQELLEKVRQKDEEEAALEERARQFVEELFEQIEDSKRRKRLKQSR
jgi:hypothetical protein